MCKLCKFFLSLLGKRMSVDKLPLTPSLIWIKTFTEKRSCHHSTITFLSLCLISCSHALHYFHASGQPQQLL